MRAIILVAGAALALTACGNNGQADNTTNIEQGLTAESIVSNDVTAIDAVTGAAANMAADIPIDFTNGLDNELGNAATPADRGSRPSTTTPPSREVPTSNETDGNEVANAVAE